MTGQSIVARLLAQANCESPPVDSLLREAAAALEAAREDAEILRRLISSIPRTTVSTQREGSDPMREDWAAFDEVPAYITFDADVVAAIDQARGIVPEAGLGVGK